MSVSAKDTRITDLFTEGSHHRSLSVISINQNMFARKDPIQRRNCSRFGHSSVHIEKPLQNKQEVDLLTESMPENACDDCGLLFDSAHDVQRHVKRGWCPENNMSA